MKILIVEDEVLVAAELEWMVEDFGHVCVGSAVDSREALALAAEAEPELALVDVCLLDGPTGVDVARCLTALGVMVLFLTANPKRLPDDLAGAFGVVPKPYAPGAVRHALVLAEAGLRARVGEARPNSGRGLTGTACAGMQPLIPGAG